MAGKSNISQSQNFNQSRRTVPECKNQMLSLSNQWVRHPLPEFRRMHGLPRVWKISCMRRCIGWAAFFAAAHYCYLQLPFHAELYCVLGLSVPSSPRGTWISILQQSLFLATVERTCVLWCCLTGTQQALKLHPPALGPMNYGMVVLDCSDPCIITCILHATVQCASLKSTSIRRCAAQLE